MVSSSSSINCLWSSSKLATSHQVSPARPAMIHLESSVHLHLSWTILWVMGYVSETHITPLKQKVYWSLLWVTTGQAASSSLSSTAKKALERGHHRNTCNPSPEPGNVVKNQNFQNKENQPPNLDRYRGRRNYRCQILRWHQTSIPTPNFWETSLWQILQAKHSSPLSYFRNYQLKYASRYGKTHSFPAELFSSDPPVDHHLGYAHLALFF